MTGRPEGAAEVPGDSGSTNSLSNEVRGRKELATGLENLAEELAATSRRLKRTWPDPGQPPSSVWRPGLVEMQGCIDRVDGMQVDCQSTVAQESETSGKEDPAQPAVTQLEQAVTEAIGATLAAMDSLEPSDQPWVSDARQRYYIAAADQLAGLASRCLGLAVHMRGPEALEEEDGPEGLEKPPAS
jgi:hypothetical protein